MASSSTVTLMVMLAVGVAGAIQVTLLPVLPPGKVPRDIDQRDLSCEKAEAHPSGQYSPRRSLSSDSIN